MYVLYSCTVAKMWPVSSVRSHGSTRPVWTAASSGTKSTSAASLWGMRSKSKNKKKSHKSHKHSAENMVRFTGAKHHAKQDVDSTVKDSKACSMKCLSRKDSAKAGANITMKDSVTTEMTEENSISKSKFYVKDSTMENLSTEDRLARDHMKDAILKHFSLKDLTKHLMTRSTDTTKDINSNDHFEESEGKNSAVEELDISEEEICDTNETMKYLSVDDSDMKRCSILDSTLKDSNIEKINNISKDESFSKKDAITECCEDIVDDSHAEHSSSDDCIAKEDLVVNSSCMKDCNSVFKRYILRDFTKKEVRKSADSLMKDAAVGENSGKDSAAKNTPVEEPKPYATKEAANTKSDFKRTSVLKTGMKKEIMSADSILKDAATGENSGIHAVAKDTPVKVTKPSTTKESSNSKKESKKTCVLKSFTKKEIGNSVDSIMKDSVAGENSGEDSATKDTPVQEPKPSAIKESSNTESESHRTSALKGSAKKEIGKSADSITKDAATAENSRKDSAAKDTPVKVPKPSTIKESSNSKSESKRTSVLKAGAIRNHARVKFSKRSLNNKPKSINKKEVKVCSASTMLQQILQDMFIDPELLAELDDEQKQILFCKMREEQVRRWKEREGKLEEEEKKKPKKKSSKSNKKRVDFLTGKDGNPWTWVMGEHTNDLSVEQILEKEAQERASKLAEKEAEELARKQEDERQKKLAEEKERLELDRKAKEEELSAKILGCKKILAAAGGPIPPPRYKKGKSPPKGPPNTKSYIPGESMKTESGPVRVCPGVTTVKTVALSPEEDSKLKTKSGPSVCTGQVKTESLAGDLKARGGPTVVSGQPKVVTPRADLKAKSGPSVDSVQAKTSTPPIVDWRAKTGLRKDLKTGKGNSQEITKDASVKDLKTNFETPKSDPKTDSLKLRRGPKTDSVKLVGYTKRESHKTENDNKTGSVQLRSDAAEGSVQLRSIPGRLSVREEAGSTECVKKSEEAALYQSMKEARLAVQKFEEARRQREAEQEKKLQQLKEKEEVERRRSIKEIDKLKRRRSTEIYTTFKEARKEFQKQAEENIKKVEEEWQQQERKAKEAEAQLRAIARRAREEHRRSILDGRSTVKTESKIMDMIDEDSAHDKPPIATKPSKNHLANNKPLQFRPARPPSRKAIVDWFQEVEQPRGAGMDPKTQHIAPWFHGIITRQEAEVLLQEKPVGTFLVRVSERVWGYAISYRAADRCKHFLIDTSDGSYQFFGTNQIAHPKLSDLVHFHREKPISGLGQEFLIHPCAQSSEPPDFHELFESYAKESSYL